MIDAGHEGLEAAFRRQGLVIVFHQEHSSI